MRLRHRRNKSALPRFKTSRRISQIVFATVIMAALPARIAGGSGAAPSPKSAATIVGADSDALGTNWYPNAGIPPSEVNASDFAQLFDITLPDVDSASAGEIPAGQIYAQPVIADGVLLVVTENDNAYGLDPGTAAVEWSRNFGPAWQSSTINCGDLAPNVGTTGTPVVDATTGIAYFTTDTAPPAGGALWQMQAVDIATGDEAVNFPVAIQGAATNAPSGTAPVFDPALQLQRPGLALVNNVVYAAFGSHCDDFPWYGWIAGVTTYGTLNDMWVDEIGSGLAGAGIWGPGGIVVDDAGNLYVATGNGTSPSPGPGLGVAQPPGLGECVIKLSTSGANLSLADYFCPSDADSLNSDDGDLGSGSPTGLPASFGTSRYPDLLVEAGKSGEVYLLDRDDLGGMEQGTGGGDDVVSETGPFGGAWSHPAVWPGDGGYVYITTGSPGGVAGGSTGELDVYQRVVDDGQVSLNWVGDVPNMSFGASSPIVTSDGMAAGSAVVWNIAPTGSGQQADLTAYGAVPVAGSGSAPGGSLPVLWQASIGNGANFNEPLAYDGRIYVGNSDGQVLAFGPSSGAPPLTGAAVEAPDTVLGTSSQATATFTATGEVEVTGVSISTSTPGASGAFTTAPLSPVELADGEQLALQIDFNPQIVGGQQASLTLTTNAGTVSVPLSGRGIPEGVPIAATPTSLSFGIQPIGGGAVDSDVEFDNTSSAPITLDSVYIESGASAPFAIGTIPDPLPTLSPGEVLSVPVSFTPPGTSGDFVQSFSDHLVVTSSAGEATVPLAGSAAPPPEMALSPLGLGVGTVALGQSAIVSFTVANRGGTALTITESKPPSADGFSAVTSLSEGTVIPAHTTRAETVSFSPVRSGAASATWVIGGDDASGLQTVTFTGTGAREKTIPSPLLPGWRLSGRASLNGRFLQLTGVAPNVAGAAFWATPVETNGLRASFTTRFTGGSGGDGLTLALVARSTVPSSPGGAGSGLGLSGLSSVAVAFQTWPSKQNESANAVGVVTARRDSHSLRWLTVVDAIPALRAGLTRVSVTLSGGELDVVVGGFTVLAQRVALPKRVYLGFTGANGSRTDVHLVSSVEISSG